MVDLDVSGTANRYLVKEEDAEALDSEGSSESAPSSSGDAPAPVAIITRASVAPLLK